MSAVVIALPPEPWTTVVPIALLFPVLLWIAARCQPIFAAAAAFIVTLAIVWTTTIGIGHFGDPSLPMAERVLAARAGILAVALCAYVLAALFAERRQHEAALAESEARLQEALTAGAVTTFVWDVGTNLSRRSADAAQILGFDPQQTFTPSNFLSRVHPDDRERFRAIVRAVNPERPTYTITFRFKRLDGREIWLEEIAKAEFDAVGRLVRLKGLALDVTTRTRSEHQQRLLIAALIGTDPALELFEALKRFKFRMQGLACTTQVKFIIPNRNGLVLLRDRGQAQHRPASRFHEIAAEVIEVDALHDHNDDSLFLTVESGHQRV